MRRGLGEARSKEAHEPKASATPAGGAASHCGQLGSSSGHPSIEWLRVAGASDMKSAEEDAAWIQNHRRWSREGEGNLRNKERKSNETNSEEEKEVNRRKGGRGILEGAKKKEESEDHAPHLKAFGVVWSKWSLQTWSVPRKLVIWSINPFHLVG